jgi:hypothetical protein
MDTFFDEGFLSGCDPDVFLPEDDFFTETLFFSESVDFVSLFFNR